MPVATLVDVLRIQSFVFASNRLRDVVSGSDVVAEVASEPFVNGFAKNGQVVYAAGGNALLSFDGPTDACTFAARISRRVAEDFPGLDLEIVHRPHPKGDWGRSVIEAHEEMRQRKLAHRPHVPLLGISVTAECAETRGVAGWRDLRDGKPLSSSIALRRKRGRDPGHWKDSLEGRALEFPLELDDLGRSPDKISSIAVVHLDGNGVGARMAEWLQEHRDDDDDVLRRKQRKLSSGIHDVLHEALRAVLAAVESGLDRGEEGEMVLRSRRTGVEIALREKGAESPRVFLPIRPVLLGGDDLTFVCDGRIGLTLARVALEAVRAKQVPGFGSALGACAGVAVVRSHAPFSRAYELAEDLCRHAKRWLTHNDGARDGYAIDWHRSFGPLLENVQALRRRQYRTDGAPGPGLTMRPYALGQAGQRPSFTWLDDDVLGGPADRGFLGRRWQESRSKVKELARLVREPIGAVSSALDVWRSTSDGFPGLPAGIPDSGFDGGATPLLDAIELLDLHLPLT